MHLSLGLWSGEGTGFHDINVLTLVKQKFCKNAYGKCATVNGAGCLVHGSLACSYLSSMN